MTAGQFHPIDGKHFAPDQPLLVADEKYLTEELGDLVTERANEVGDGGEVRGGVAGQCNEDDMFAAGRLDVSATDDALTVGEQDNLEQHCGRVRGGAGGVVLVVGVEAAEVDLMVEQVVECVLDSARQELPLQVYCNQARTGVDMFVTRHLPLRRFVIFFDLDI